MCCHIHPREKMHIYLLNHHIHKGTKDDEAMIKRGGVRRVKRGTDHTPPSEALTLPLSQRQTHTQKSNALCEYGESDMSLTVMTDISRHFSPLHRCCATGRKTLLKCCLCLFKLNQTAPRCDFRKHTGIAVCMLLYDTAIAVIYHLCNNQLVLILSVKLRNSWTSISPNFHWDIFVFSFCSVS